METIIESAAKAGSKASKSSKTKKIKIQKGYPDYSLSVGKNLIKLKFARAKKKVSKKNDPKAAEQDGLRISVKQAKPVPGSKGAPETITRQVTCKINTDNFNCSFNTDLADLLKPGLIYDLKDIAGSKYKKIDLPRNPVVLYADRLPVNNASVVIDDPDESTIAVAMEKLRARRQDAPVGKDALIKINEIFSKTDFYLHVNAGGHYFTAEMEAFYSSSQKSTSRKYLVDVTNELYALNIEMPQKQPETFFKDANVEIDKDWVMVSRVTFGQRILILIESDTVLTKDDFGFEASFEIGFAGAHAGLEIKNSSLHKTKSVNIKVWGAKEIGFDGLSLKNIKHEISGFLGKATNYKNSWGYPLRYHLSFLNGDIAKISSGLVMDSSIVDVQGNTFKVSLKSLTCNKNSDSGSTEEYYGSARIRAFDGKHVEISDRYHYNKPLKVPVLSKIFSVVPVIPIGSDADEVYIELDEGDKELFAKPGAVILDDKYTRIFTMPYDDNRAFFTLEGSLNEDDNWPNADDRFKGIFRKIRLSDVINAGGTIDVDLEFAKQGGKATLTFQIESIQA
ncbi:hypothetical protein GS399_04820 [Pedobacter sp. HMF7647]|uniref:Uncharacterized protein n=1 Tax=Hufsiella arboris TaxID=2695275 RepID=A0A7K1Y6U3_9SPHI|nr:thiol-activated cytolysin family protein [Hufsiella arboris]MXV50285.1 hypothetical protein [Hufsiella arboris]